MEVRRRGIADRLPICIHRHRDTKKLFLRCTHIGKVTGKGKAQIGEMYVILSDSHLDTRIKRWCILMNHCTEAGICRRGVGRGRELVQQRKTSQMTAAKKILGSSKMTGNIVLRADLRMYPLKRNRGMIKSEWQHNVRACQKRDCPP